MSLMDGMVMVDDMDRDQLEHWIDVSAVRWRTLQIYRFGFRDDQPDPLNSQADAMEVVEALNLELLHVPTHVMDRRPWVARQARNREISIRGESPRDAIARMYVVAVNARYVPG